MAELDLTLAIRAAKPDPTRVADVARTTLETLAESVLEVLDALELVGVVEPGRSMLADELRQAAELVARAAAGLPVAVAPCGCRGYRDGTGDPCAEHFPSRPTGREVWIDELAVEPPARVVMDWAARFVDVAHDGIVEHRPTGFVGARVYGDRELVEPYLLALRQVERRERIIHPDVYGPVAARSA